MNKWSTTNLGSVATFRTGKLDSNAAEENGLYPFFTCSPETYKINTYAFDTEAVLLAGNNANAIYPIKYYKGKFNAYQRTYVIEPKSAKLADCRYLYYLVSFLLQKLKVASVGSATKFLTKQILENFEVEVPPLEEQKAIAKILSSLDDKIELNRRMNATLEAMARALFKAWFVDFEPVHANKENRPSTSASPEIANLFPSTFENGSPNGWREGTIADLARISKESVSPGKFPDEQFHHFSIPAFDDGKHPKREPGSTILSNKFLIQRNSVLVSKLNPRIFRAWTVFPATDGRCIASTEFIVYEARQDAYWSFLNSLLRSDEIISSFQQHVTGTSGSHQRVKPESTLIIPVVIPSEQLLETFNETIAPIYSLAQVNIDQIQSLSRIRDSLLPRLISGKLKVGKAEERELVI